jgi:hypothetical protein
MKKLIFTFIVLISGLTVSYAQTTAKQLTGADCNGVNHDLYADLDAGKAVVVFFFMNSCGSCPPPAKKIQTMAKNVMNQYPGMVKGYVMPYNNSTNCTATLGWVNNNGLDLYAPFDSGASQVAYYGGFGMPTVVLLGGQDHRILFSTQSFVNGDTTIMRDSILALLGASTGIKNSELVSSFNIYPNPSSEYMQIDLTLHQEESIKIDIINTIGEVIAHVHEEKIPTTYFHKQVSISSLPNGVYFLKVSAAGRSQTHKFTVAR